MIMSTLRNPAFRKGTRIQLVKVSNSGWGTASELWRCQQGMKGHVGSFHESYLHLRSQ